VAALACGEIWREEICSMMVEMAGRTKNSGDILAGIMYLHVAENRAALTTEVCSLSHQGARLLHRKWMHQGTRRLLTTTATLCMTFDVAWERSTQQLFHIVLCSLHGLPISLELNLRNDESI